LGNRKIEADIRATRRTAKLLTLQISGYLKQGFSPKKQGILRATAGDADSEAKNPCGHVAQVPYWSLCDLGRILFPNSSFEAAPHDAAG
jgi:hypothetical protein